MNTCDTCKYWEREIITRGHKKGEFRYPWGACRAGVGGIGCEPTSDGCICDGRQEDGTGDGLTGPRFGCIHHEAKLAPTKDIPAAADHFPQY